LRLLALVRIPVFALTQISLMPGGARNGISGLPASAIFMKSRKIGKDLPHDWSEQRHVLGFAA
jgi:hypothetical protein